MVMYSVAGTTVVIGAAALEIVGVAIIGVMPIIGVIPMPTITVGMSPETGPIQVTGQYTVHSCVAWVKVLIKTKTG